MLDIWSRTPEKLGYCRRVRDLRLLLGPLWALNNKILIRHPPWTGEHSGLPGPITGRDSAFRPIYCGESTGAGLSRIHRVGASFGNLGSFCARQSSS